MNMHDFLYTFNKVWTAHVDFYTKKIPKALVYQKELYDEVYDLLLQNKYSELLQSNNALVREMIKDIEWYYTIYELKKYPIDLCKVNIGHIAQDMNILTNLSLEDIHKLVITALRAVDSSTIKGKNSMLFLQKVLFMYPLKYELYKQIDTFFAIHRVNVSKIIHVDNINSDTLKDIIDYINKNKSICKPSPLSDFCMQCPLIVNYLMETQKTCDLIEITRYITDFGYNYDIWLKAVYERLGAHGVKDIFKSQSAKVLVEQKYYFQDTIPIVLPLLLKLGPDKFEDIDTILKKYPEFKKDVTQHLMTNVNPLCRITYNEALRKKNRRLELKYRWAIDHLTIQDNLPLLLDYYFEGLKNKTVFVTLGEPMIDDNNTLSVQEVDDIAEWVKDRISFFIGQDIVSFLRDILPIIKDTSSVKGKAYERFAKKSILEHTEFSYVPNEELLML